MQKRTKESCFSPRGIKDLIAYALGGAIAVGDTKAIAILTKELKQLNTRKD